MRAADLGLDMTWSADGLGLLLFMRTAVLGVKSFLRARDVTRRLLNTPRLYTYIIDLLIRP